MRGAFFFASFALCLLFLALLAGRHSDSRMDTIVRVFRSQRVLRRDMYFLFVWVSLGLLSTCVTTGWIFEISLCENSNKKSKCYEGFFDYSIQLARKEQCRYDSHKIFVFIFQKDEE